MKQMGLSKNDIILHVKNIILKVTRCSWRRQTSPPVPQSGNWTKYTRRLWF